MNTNTNRLSPRIIKRQLMQQRRDDRGGSYSEVTWYNNGDLYNDNDWIVVGSCTGESYL